MLANERIGSFSTSPFAFLGLADGKWGARAPSHAVFGAPAENCLEKRAHCNGRLFLSRDAARRGRRTGRARAHALPIFVLTSTLSLPSMTGRIGPAENFLRTVAGPRVVSRHG